MIRVFMFKDITYTPERGILAWSRGATSWVPTYGSERPLDRVASSDVTQDMLVALKMMRVDIDICMMRSP